MGFQNILVTGANRGIGLEFVRQLVRLNPPAKNLIVTTRKDCAELNSLKTSNSNLHVLNYDAAKYDSYEEFASQVKAIVADDGLDLLINNAGVLVRSNIESVTPEDMLTNFNINSVAPLILTKTLLPLLKLSSAKRRTVVVNVSSKIGSISDASSGGTYAYRASKVALNMITKCLSVDLASTGIILLALHPGWVLTDMGGPNALIDTNTSVSSMLNVIQTCTKDQSGSFLSYNGDTIAY